MISDLILLTFRMTRNIFLSTKWLTPTMLLEDVQNRHSCELLECMRMHKVHSCYSRTEVFFSIDLKPPDTVQQAVLEVVGGWMVMKDSCCTIISKGRELWNPVKLLKAEVQFA